MPAFVNVSGTWRRIKDPEVKISGSFRDFEQATVRIAGEYRPILGWDVTGAAPVTTFNVSAEEMSPISVAFKQDGTKMYVIGGREVVFQYSLSTPWSIATASYDGISLDVGSRAAGSTNARGLSFKPDGTELYFLDSIQDRINQFTLTTPWDLGTAGSVATTSPTLTDPRSIAFKSDGTLFYHPIFSGGIATYSMSTPWEVNTASFVSTQTFETTADGIAFTPDGRRVFLSKDNLDQVKQYDLTTPWSLASTTFAGTYSIPSPADNIAALAFRTNGRKMYMVDNFDSTVNEFSL